MPRQPLTNRLCYAAAGMATQLSRRRVSCRELGRPDCDGWLLLRKVPGGFMGPRWRRCWFVLKGHTLYWYLQPQVRPRTHTHTHTRTRTRTRTCTLIHSMRSYYVHIVPYIF